MGKRVSLSALDFDKKYQELLQQNDQNTNEELRKVAKRAIIKVIENDITPRQREMLKLYYFENHEMKDIAKILEINPSTVSRTISRARRNILDRLKYYFE